MRVRSTTAVLLLSLSALALLLPACRARRGAGSGTATAPTSGAVLIASVVDLSDGKVDTPGDWVRRGLRSAAAERDLEPRELPHDTIIKRFSALPDSEQRLTQLATFARDAAFILLLETRAQFQSQSAGRYRWVVHSRVTGHRIDAEDPPVVTAIDIPVILSEPGDRPRDAVTAAAPAIAGQVASLLDNLQVTP